MKPNTEPIKKKTMVYQIPGFNNTVVIYQEESTIETYESIIEALDFCLDAMHRRVKRLNEKNQQQEEL